MKIDSQEFSYDQQVTQDQDHPTYFNSEASWWAKVSAREKKRFQNQQRILKDKKEKRNIW